ncbi:uncharacterized protein LOC143358688 [Halictus rubicundus]|uniref:uncharacterized protein LOC143358688 n=1 Tax=Halictus rubicundus TaxID=77578 RepID=UPI00403728DB
MRRSMCRCLAPGNPHSRISPHVRISQENCHEIQKTKRTAIDRSSGTDVSGSEVAMRQRKEETMPEVVPDARNRSNDLPASKNRLSDPFAIITGHFEFSLEVTSSGFHCY